MALETMGGSGYSADVGLSWYGEYMCHPVSHHAIDFTVSTWYAVIVPSSSLHPLFLAGNEIRRMRYTVNRVNSAAGYKIRC